MRSGTFSIEFDLDNDFTLEANGTYDPGTPERTSGPPEACDPGDPPELEIDELKLSGPGGVPSVNALPLITFFGLEETLDAKVLAELADFDPGYNDPDEYNPE